jgi:hypothetical protein
MYHLSVVFSAYVPRLVGALCIWTAHSSGARGMALLSNWPWTYWCANTVGKAFDCLSKVKVRIVCGSNLPHSFTGNVSSNPCMIALKWFLKVWMALSARFFW